MSRKLIKYTIPTAVPVIVAAGALIAFSGNSKSNYRLDKFNLSAIPGMNAADWKRNFETSPVPHLILQKTNSDIKKYVFSTADCGIIKHGYKNSVELFVIFGRQGKMENIILGKNIETPGLIAKMRRNGFFQQWKGKKKLKKVQYVSGATYSCKAVSGGVSALQELLKHENFIWEN